MLKSCDDSYIDPTNWSLAAIGTLLFSPVAGIGLIGCDSPECTVRNIEEVLREKELEIEKLRREIEALHSVTPLLAEPNSQTRDAENRSEVTKESGSELGEALRAAAPLLADDTEEFDPGVRARLIEAGEIHSKREASKLSRQLRSIAAPLLGWREDRHRSLSILP